MVRARCDVCACWRNALGGRGRDAKGIKVDREPYLSISSIAKVKLQLQPRLRLPCLHVSRTVTLNTCLRTYLPAISGASHALSRRARAILTILLPFTPRPSSRSAAAPMLMRLCNPPSRASPL